MTKLKNYAKVAFCFVYKKWLKTFVDNKDDLLVKAFDFLFGSNCKYCMAVRAILFTLSFFIPWHIGLIIGLTVILFTYGEKVWLCSSNEENVSK